MLRETITPEPGSHGATYDHAAFVANLEAEVARLRRRLLAEAPADGYIEKLKAEVELLRKHQSDLLWISGGLGVLVPLAFAFGKAIGLRERPTLKERFGSWLIERGFALAGSL